MWGQDAFVIPYQWSNNTDPMNARSVELYASTDRGRSWQKISEAQPSVRNFTYRAPGDGEYWFAIRTIDATGNAWPAGPMQAELQVVVDTQSPQIIRLDGVIDAAGQVTASWQAYDAHLDNYSWTLRYRTDQMTDWQTVTPNTAGPASPTLLVGQATWRVAPGTKQVYLQASVRDRAGNSRELGAVASASAIPPGQLVGQGYPQPTIGSASADGGPAFPSPQFGFASRPALLPSLPATGATNDPFAAAGQATLPALPPIDSGPQSSPAYSQAAPQFAQPQALSQPATSGWGNSLSAPASSSWPVDNTASTPYSSSTNSPSLSPWGPSPSENTNASSATGGLSPIGGSQSSVNHFASLSSGEPPQLAAAAPTAPQFAGQADQYVNDLEFEIDYQVDRAGTFGVSRVELWGTRDGGRSWRRLAIDSDNVSPIRASVPEPGDYGLRIVVETAGGLDPRTPRPGDRPELTLRVDTDRPTAQLMDVKQGEAYFADHLVITWQASDADLSETPISLSYSSRAGGPWIPLATGLANSGRYSWRLQRHLPGQIYIRLEATDRAGNVTSSTTPTPISVSLPVPTGSLQSVRGVGR